MSIELDELHKYLKAKPGAKLEYPFGPQPAVYKIDDRLFILVNEDKAPLRISLKCDPSLSEILRSRYESVMPGYHLNKRHWNTIVLTGQLTDQEVYDLIDHSYRLVINNSADQLAQ